MTEENAGASQNKLKYFFTRNTQGRLMHMIDYTEVTPKTYCYILDVHGNVVALADENGNRVVNYEYDTWGNLTNTPEAVTTGNGEYLRNVNPFHYSSYQFDPESGLYYLKARYYSATIGRFLTRDTLYELINNFSSVNQYVYCENNPIRYFDPSGHVKISRYGIGFKIALSHKETMTLVRGLAKLAAGATAVAIISVLIPDPTITKVVAVAFGLAGLAYGTYATIIWTYDDGYGVTLRASLGRMIGFESNTSRTPTR